MITEMKHGADRAKIYLFHARPTCGIILLKMTQCVVGFSLLLEWNVRKSNTEVDLFSYVLLILGTQGSTFWEEMQVLHRYQKLCSATLKELTTIGMNLPVECGNVQDLIIGLV